MGVFAQPVPSNVLQFAALQTSYLSLAGAMLGDTATPGDGFDADYQSTVVQTPSTDAGFSASDAAFNALVDAFAGFYDSGIDDLAGDLGSQTAALNVPENAFFGAVGGLGSPLNLPATPSDVSVPDFNVSTGIPAPPSLPNPPVTTPPSGGGGGGGIIPPYFPEPGVGVPGNCNPSDLQGLIAAPGVDITNCFDIFGMPTTCECGCDPFEDPDCTGPTLTELT